MLALAGRRSGAQLVPSRGAADAAYDVGMSGADEVGSRQRLFRAAQPLLDAAGATLADPRDLVEGDVPLEWDGEVVAAVKLPFLHRSMERLIAQVETELGAPLAELSRQEKQHAVARLDELGAFTLRGAVEELARVIGVSRITIYSYLNQRYR
jgi:hypothetical protein